MLRKVDLKRLGIGSVQFGIEYGITNAVGQLTKENVRDILKLANQQGIETLDTAYLYGQSESVLGETLPSDHTFKIVTKSERVCGDVVNQHSCTTVERAFQQSLENLKASSVYGLLVHNAEDLIKPGGHQLLSVLDKLQEQGLVQKIGISVYNAEQIDAILDMFIPDIVQLPISIADQRLKISGHLSKLYEMGVEIHARSLFLQGILLIPPELLPTHFAPVKQYFIDFKNSAARAGMNQLQACIRFALEQPEISTAVLGVTSEKELTEILTAPAFCSDLGFLSPEAALNDELYTNPLNWIL